MEKIQQHQWWRLLRQWLSYKNATLLVCLLNVIGALVLLQCFISSSSSSHTNAIYRHIKESEDIRRSMIPLDLINRVREIGREAYIEKEKVQLKDVKQTAAVDLISRLNNFRSYSDTGNLKALEEWRKRKMEHARQRSSIKNGTASA